ncbi:hypothetical protein [Pseudomonas folii]|uniref:Uncharacterized protein n=1 Tax=Pseudomonas folii TaxID=2762593 RepID=A0ABR7AVF4_9PSED|nr:hypothetical protein [Pseudomonas folii]MBC3948370.1 hypothetical protein [Pseudomonas folii]
MRYLIVRRRHLGVAIDKTQLRKIQPVLGDIHISEMPNETLGRTTISAWLFSSAPNAPDILPRLLDVQVTGMSHNGMNLTGVEQIGDAFYAQSWWCRIE